MSAPVAATATAAVGSGMSSATTAYTACERKRLFITHVDVFGPYLKIFGQLNPDAVNIVRSKLHQLLSTCSAIDPSRQQALLRIGSLCLYKRINGAAPADFELLRARICNVIQGATVALANSLQVEVEFIDYGYNALVSSYEILFPQHPELLQNIPPLCTQYIALGICTDWKKTELDEIKRMIVQKTLDITIEMEFNQFKFITMKWKEFNFAEFLIHQRGIGAPVANALLRDNFIKIFKQQQQQSQQNEQQKYTNNNNLSINNNLNYNNNSSVNTITHQQHQHQQTASIIYPPMGVGVASAGIGVATYADNHMHDQMASRRSLAARLQQHQIPMQNVIIPVQPRMPHTIGNLRSIVQGIHVQNNRMPYTGQNYQTVVSTDTTTSVYSTAAVPPSVVYNARYHRPQVPQPLMTPLQQNQGQQLQLQQQPMRTTATFKSNNLTVGNCYDVCVSFVENGPCLFSVQLINVQAELTEMMNQIEKVQLKQFTEKPVLGTACIARYSEDGQLYRALITGVQPTACKVAYIDYGNAELVNFRDLYEIPEDFLRYKAFAIRFTLSGHKDLEPIDESLKKAFKDLVIYKNCTLKVMPLEGPPLVQYCELYMQDKNIIEVLKQIQKCRLVYAKAEPLQNNDIVEIRYIDSPKHFYVQKAANIVEFEHLMDDMFLYYNKNQKVPNHLSLGAPCIVKYDKEWYRAEVMRADATAIIVRHVDFGYEQKVTKNLLSTIAEKHLKLPRQAVQCCLKGFENNELNKDLATTQFEMLAEESNRKRRSFTVKVFRIQPDGLNLVNLCTKDLNVMKKLYKLSMPFEQYLTLEKDDFNVQAHNGHTTKVEVNGGGGGEGRKTPSSIASSNEVLSVQSSKKGNILNSTTLQSYERQQQQQQNTKNQHKGQLQQRYQNNPTNPSEWDKHSSASSSVDNRDSRSSSSEHKQLGKRGQKNRNYHQQQQQDNKLNVSISSSSDRRSNGSGGANYNNKQQRNNNLPPRLQNIKTQQENNRQQQKSSNAPNLNSVQQQQQRASSVQRSLNAPQGYSSQPQRHHKLSGSGGRSSKDPTSGEEPLTSGSEQQNTEEYLPFERPFPRQHIETPAREEVTICWWISPHQFYTHLKSRNNEFERLMRRMQQFYKNKPNQQLQLKVGSYIVARYRKDNILYRARIIACNQMLRKYKVQFVDFGSTYTVGAEDIWQVEKRFGDFPCMAYQCAISGIISNIDHLLIIDRMEKYLPAGSKLTCEYIERVEDDGDMYYVNVNVNNMSLRETLKLDGLITDVCPELRLDLLPGQQIRAKITSIKDMLSFKIQIEGCDEHIKFLCSYDDVRYVKSNHDVAVKFKEFYEGKSCVVNITDITDNKVILLRPLLPMLKEDIPTYICTYPIILESFQVRVIYIESGYRLYVHMLSTETEIAELLDEMYAYYKTGGTSLKTFETDLICAANSADGNWYRARIISRVKNTKDLIEVYYIDYGNKEKIEQKKLKQLDEKFYKYKSAFAIQVNLPIRITTEQQSKSKHSKKSNESSNSSADETTLLNELKALAYNQVATVKSIEIRRNRLIADLNREGQSLVQLLKDKQLIRGKDVDYMCKLLEKEKPNILEYIETVDLTLEDEDEHDKKIGSIKSRNSGSPKKKKPAKEAKKPKERESDEPKENIVVVPKEIIKSTIEVVPQPKMEIIPSPIVEVPIIKVPEIIAVVKPVSKPTTPIPTPVPTPTPSTPEPPELDPYVDMEHAVLSHCDNPTRFFVHLQDKLEELRNLQENLQIVASSLPPLMSVSNGAYCISHYSVDKQWYRAKIMDAELMVIQFIDYGNTDALTDTTDIKEMGVFPDIAPLCLPCALPIKPNGTADWVDAANAIFNDSYQKVLHYEYITRGDFIKKSYIRLLIDGVNVADKLVQDGFAKPLVLVESGENCFISHVNSLTDFYIQYEKDSKALELIEIYLAGKEQLPPITKFERNKIVAALFPDDENWYRAKLLREIPSKGYEVLFIDYGNTSTSPECREISQEISQLPPLSKKCALELPERCISWSDQAEEKFSEIAALGETIFTVELREPASDHAIVDLLIDGQNIVEELAVLCEQKALPVDVDVLNSSFCNTSMHTSVYEGGERLDAIISHANSPSDFYVQFNKDAIRLEDMTNTLNSLGMDELLEPAVEQICAAVYTEDGALYRARILEIISKENKEYRVRFIDFGNEAISNDLRQLPHDLLQLKEFAKHCQLENANCFTSASLAGVAAETFNVLIDECQGLVKVELLDQIENGCTEEGNAEPVLIKLFAGNTEDNLCEKLHKLLTVASEANSIASFGLGGAPSQQKTCIISYGISPREFYIQLRTNSGKMEAISKALIKESVEKGLGLLQNAEVGRVCCVYCTEDDCYYRGRIERVLAADGGYEIFLLDYGNCIVSTQIRELPEELRSIPALALKCQLNNLPLGARESALEEHFGALVEAHFGEVFEIESDELDPETRLHTVKLHVNYKDLAEELANAVELGSTVVEVLSPVPTLRNCSVIQVNSPSSFYIQLASDVAALEEITDILLDAESDFEPFSELAVGAICAAQFPEDMAYYRARIVQLLDGTGKCEVHYIDFGNNAITDQFRKLPSKMLQLEGYAKHCSLEKCAELGFNTIEASAQFQTLIDSRFIETFQVELLKTTADPIICRLFFQDKNVAHELQQLLKDCVVKNTGADDKLDWRDGENGTALNPSSGVSSMGEPFETTAEQ